MEKWHRKEHTIIIIIIIIAVVTNSRWACVAQMGFVVVVAVVCVCVCVLMPSRDGDVMVYVKDINQPSSPTP